jgi:NAD(P)-dependent dehydrogenase (short-subunit alcohol dehydrogenase family)
MARIVLIGGSYGIGFDLAKILLAHGNEVIVCSRSEANLKEIKGVKWHYFDVLNPDFSNIIVEGNIDGLVYLPGSILLKPFNRTTKQDFLNDFHINVLGAVACIQQFLPQLKEAKGSVVLISSVASKLGMPFHSSIATSKSALEGLGKSLAAELAPAVRVNMVAPSLTETPLAEKFLNTPEKRDSSSKRHPLGRFGQASDIANVVSFLLSPQSSWITGQVLHSDGGMSSVKLM